MRPRARRVHAPSIPDRRSDRRTGDNTCTPIPTKGRRALDLAVPAAPAPQRRPQAALGPATARDARVRRACTRRGAPADAAALRTRPRTAAARAPLLGLPPLLCGRILLHLFFSVPRLSPSCPCRPPAGRDELSRLAASRDARRPPTSCTAPRDACFAAYARLQTPIPINLPVRPLLAAPYASLLPRHPLHVAAVPRRSHHRSCLRPLAPTFATACFERYITYSHEIIMRAAVGSPGSITTPTSRMHARLC